MEWDFIHLDECASTNSWLTERRPARATVVWTDYQTAGRGCGSNRWESERGQNLSFSILFRPEHLSAECQYLVSMATACALCRVLTVYVGAVSIKWPNDIYVGDRKLSGTLIEQRLAGGLIRESVIGVGLNVNQQRFVSDAPNPVSMAQLTGRTYNCEQLLHQLVEAFDQEWADVDGLRQRYLSQLYRRTGLHRYADAEGDFEAELVTVQDDGRLVLRDAQGRLRTYAFKEVTFRI